MEKNGVSGTLTSCLSNLDVVFVRISWNANRPMDTKMDKPMELETALTLLHYLHMYVGARKTVIFFRGRKLQLITEYKYKDTTEPFEKTVIMSSLSGIQNPLHTTSIDAASLRRRLRIAANEFLQNCVGEFRFIYSIDKINTESVRSAAITIEQLPSVDIAKPTLLVIPAYVIAAFGQILHAELEEHYDLHVYIEKICVFTINKDYLDRVVLSYQSEGATHHYTNMDLMKILEFHADIFVRADRAPSYDDLSNVSTHSRFISSDFAYPVKILLLMHRLAPDSLHRMEFSLQDRIYRCYSRSRTDPNTGKRIRQTVIESTSAVCKVKFGQKLSRDSHSYRQLTCGNWRQPHVQEVEDGEVDEKTFFQIMCEQARASDTTLLRISDPISKQKLYESSEEAASLRSERSPTESYWSDSVDSWSSQSDLSLQSLPLSEAEIQLGINKHILHQQSVGGNHFDSTFTPLRLLSVSEMSQIEEQLTSVAYLFERSVNCMIQHYMLQEKSKELDMICIAIKPYKWYPRNENWSGFSYAMIATFGQLVHAKLSGRYTVYIALEDRFAMTLALDSASRNRVILEEANLLF